MAPAVDPSWPASQYPELFYPEPGPGAAPLRSDAIIVGLGPHDVGVAMREGEWRYRHAKGKRTRQRYGAGERYATEEARIELDVQAAGAELAVARRFGLLWSGAHHASPYDVEGWMEVRFRRRDPEHPEHVDLWIRLSDAKEKPGPYVLVTGELPVYVLRGWIEVPGDLRAEWCVRHSTRDEAAYVVPVAALRSLHALPGRR